MKEPNINLRKNSNGFGELEMMEKYRGPLGVHYSTKVEISGAKQYIFPAYYLDKNTISA